MDNVPAYTGNSFMSHSTVSTFLQGWDGSGPLDLVDFQFNSKRVPVHISNNNRKINPTFLLFLFLKKYNKQILN